MIALRFLTSAVRLIPLLVSLTREVGLRKAWPYWKLGVGLRAHRVTRLSLARGLDRMARNSAICGKSAEAEFYQGLADAVGMEVSSLKSQVSS